MSIATIKAQAKVLLDELVTATVLNGASTSDIKTDPLNSNVGNYPHAFLMPPSVESEVLDNRTIIRTYTFDILVLFNAQNITGSDDVETAIESILDKFDNNPTLNGSALGGILPVSSAPAPFQHNGKDLILVVVRVQAKELVTLTFA
jgi:hypothetical protein